MHSGSDFEKMKISILSLNSQYIHSALAPWYLKAALGGGDDITVVDTSINEPHEQVLARVFFTQPELLCVPCYIWNIEYVCRICCDIKAAMPECRIFLGGPEVSFRAREFLEEHIWADAVLCGEGEEILPAAVNALPDLSGIPGVIYRAGDEILGDSTYRIVEDLCYVKSPYTKEMLASLQGRLAYYESSRGCPFSCAYCLSSASHGVRYFPLERVKEELSLLAHSNVHTIKMVDRTFNANPTRSYELLKFILEETGDVCFHLEVGADLFNDKFITLLLSAPPGKIRIEAGVQSTNPEVLKDSARVTDTEKLFSNLSRILEEGNICVHADLILGLPGEGMESFKKSFNDLYLLAPHELQLGFLKLLHGSDLCEKHDLDGFKFSPLPPYTVLKTPHLSAREIFTVQEFEDAFEKFFNSGRFLKTLDYLCGFFETPFDMYSRLAEYIRERGMTYARLAVGALFSLLHDFSATIEGVKARDLLSALRYDYFSSQFTGRPPRKIAFEEGRDFRDLCFNYLRNTNIPEKFPHYGDISPKALYKLVRFVPVGDSVILFDPARRNPVNGRILGEVLGISYPTIDI